MGLFSAGVAAGLVLFVVTGVPSVVNASSRHSPRLLWGGADLSVGLTVSPKTVRPGQWLAYEVKVRNAGPGDAVLPVLKIRVPEEVDITMVNVASCRPGAVRNEVVCPSSVDIPAGDSGGVTVVGMVREGARGPLRAVAGLTSEVADDNEADNRAEVVTRVDATAGLAARLAPSVAGAGPGRSRVRHSSGVRAAHPSRVMTGRNRRGEDRAGRAERGAGHDQRGERKLQREGRKVAGFPHGKISPQLT
ncbi:DUF11 domain-containing protein [Sphaerisporangium fuscum]|uniref:DUF11 domain-containing protein n=1 Tax=Sphaerisporangium fuscum TaxID=2835868 RepID=UPI001BDD52D0|nr:DUF11 domain-containing protein [Sphaerisporangium fuscum]